MKASSRFRTLHLPGTLLLLGVILAGCAPAAGSPVATLPAPMSETAVATGVETLAAEITVTETPGGVPVVTPRGPDLVASDPSTVRLNSGQLQLVEFFRFT